jgi:prolyl oligopeptidase
MSADERVGETPTGADEGSRLEGPGVTTDPYLWLEDIKGEAALDWVRQHNEPALAELSDEQFEQMRREVLEIAQCDTRIPVVSRRGEYLYNFWTDAEHLRGLWRRTTLDQYLTAAPEWDVLIDVDALGAADGESWVWAAPVVIRPEYTRALIRLSRGGSDATVVREFDMATRQFVADGFALPDGKHIISWEDENTVLVGTDFGEGSLTTSGYPRLVKRWRRGQPIEAAELVYTGSVTDVSVGAGVDRTPGFARTFVSRNIDSYDSQDYELREGELIRIDAPSDAVFSVHRQWLLIWLRTDWHTGGVDYRAGSLLAADYEEFLAGTAQLKVVFEPDAHIAVSHYGWTRDRLVLVTLADVASRVEVITPGDWRREPLAGIPENTTTSIYDTDDLGDETFLVSSGFDTSARLLHGPADGPLQPIKSAPEFFDATDLEVSQHFATSDDGTSVPYFLVSHRDRPGPGATLMGGYGGFAITLAPGYDGVLGRLWLARGGTYALANTRGGCEYGPDWHTQTIREGRHKVAEDFAAIARDLINRGITTPAQLGASGGSNGGLLMGIMLTQYPELFGALVCSSPLLDMRRYHVLLAGQSWMAEYGNPDEAADWEFIGKYSPYHNISTDGRYPRVLMVTSTNDDRVHPGHARKMTAALEAAGRRVLYYENIEGGHGGAADAEQAAFLTALTYRFLWRTCRT